MPRRHPWCSACRLLGRPAHPFCLVHPPFPALVTFPSFWLGTSLCLTRGSPRLGRGPPSAGDSLPNADLQQARQVQQGHGDPVRDRRLPAFPYRGQSTQAGAQLVRASLGPVGPQKGPCFLLPDSSRAGPSGQAGERVVCVGAGGLPCLAAGPQKTEGEVDSAVGWD